MYARRRVLTGAIVLSVVAAAVAQRVVVRKSGAGKIAVSLAGLRAGSDAASRTFVATLAADLNRSGYFRVSSSGAGVALSGTCATSGGATRADVQVFRVGTRERLMGKTYRVSPGAARTMAHRVADDVAMAVVGKKGMASGKIALVGNRTGRKELYVCDMDGKNLRQVTRDRSIVVGPSWAPDGQRVAYTSYKQGYPNVYVTGSAKPLSSRGGLNTGGAISPDGRSMAVILSFSGNPELYVQDLRGGRLKRLTRTRMGNEASPCWSPDGRRIAYVSDVSGTPQVYVISREGGRPRRLSGTGTENVAPDWGRNGWIAFSSRMGGHYAIVLANPDTRQVKTLSVDRADYEDPSWAPDGLHVVCSRTTPGRSSAIYLLDSRDGSAISLLSSSSDWYSPACSP